MSHPKDSTSGIINSGHGAAIFQAVRYLSAGLPPSSSLSTQSKLLGSALIAIQPTTSSFSLLPLCPQTTDHRPGHLSPPKSQRPKGCVTGPSLVDPHQPFQHHLLPTLWAISSACDVPPVPHITHSFPGRLSCGWGMSIYRHCSSADPSPHWLTHLQMPPDSSCFRSASLMTLPGIPLGTPL